MAIMNVNPTASELSRIKKKLISSRRGHKLLKDKSDELVRRFLDLSRENEKLRLETEDLIRQATLHATLSLSQMRQIEIDTAMMIPNREMGLEVESKNIMGVSVPTFKSEIIQNGEDIYPYGFAFTPLELDSVIKEYNEVSEKLIKLAETEKACQLMASEIEKTRRRVNALEHIMIPQYTDTVKYIKMKIDENERSTVARLMKANLNSK